MSAEGSIEPFTDDISLGARARLPKTFEKATAIARRISVDELDDNVLDGLLLRLARMLRHVYLAQSTGSLLTAEQAVNFELESASRPNVAGVVGQGVRLSAKERKAIELRAMEVSAESLTRQGYAVSDVSMRSPFDLLAKRHDGDIKVEVKGTTCPSPDAIFMTKNEVALHRLEKGTTALFVVTDIKLKRDGDDIEATGGSLTERMGWDIDAWELIPLAFQLRARSQP